MIGIIFEEMLLFPSFLNIFENISYARSRSKNALNLIKKLLPIHNKKEEEQQLSGNYNNLFVVQTSEE